MKYKRLPAEWTIRFTWSSIRYKTILTSLLSSGSSISIKFHSDYISALSKSPPAINVQHGSTKNHSTNRSQLTPRSPDRKHLTSECKHICQFEDACRPRDMRCVHSCLEWKLEVNSQVPGNFGTIGVVSYQLAAVNFKEVHTC